MSSNLSPTNHGDGNPKPERRGRKRPRPASGSDPLHNILRPKKKKARIMAERSAEESAVARAVSLDVKLPPVDASAAERTGFYKELGIHGRIPSGWTSHPGNISRSWELKRGVRLVVSKTPLSRAFDRLLRRQDHWRPAMLSLLSCGKVSDVIDVTFTNRYYHALELPPPIEHHKLKFQGGNTVPSGSILRSADELVRPIQHHHHPDRSGAAAELHLFCLLWCQIQDLVARRSLEAAEDGDARVIVIHCTHGINRSGFLATRWMCQFLGWDGQRALDDFERMRGVGIYREALRSALLREFPAVQVPAAAAGEESVTEEG